MIRYQIKNDSLSEGIAVDHRDLVLFKDNAEVNRAALDDFDNDAPLQQILNSFKIIDYFPEESFSLTSPKKIEFSLCLDFNLNEVIQGSFERLDDREKNVWSAEYRFSTLFSNEVNVPANLRPWKPEDEYGSKGWIFLAPFLRTGVYAEDFVLQQRVLLEMEKLAYQGKDGDSNIDLTAKVDNIFSKESPAWGYSIPVLEA